MLSPIRIEHVLAYKPTTDRSVMEQTSAALGRGMIDEKQLPSHSTSSWRRTYAAFLPIVATGRC